MFCRRSRARAFRALGSCRFRVFKVRVSGLCFKVAVRIFEEWLDMTLGIGRVPAGVNRVLLEKSAAGWKLIRKPSQVGICQLLWLCDLRSREVCLYRAPKDFALLKTRWAPGGRHNTAVNLSESTLMGQTMSIAIFLCLTTVLTVGWNYKLGQHRVVSGINRALFHYSRPPDFSL